MTWHRRMVTCLAAASVGTAGILGCNNDSGAPSAPSTVSDSGTKPPTDAVEPEIATPTFYPPSGIFESAQRVTIRTWTPGATIYYTLDGSTPNASSTLYSSPISVAKATGIRAIAIKEGAKDSAIGSATYLINIRPGSTPPVHIEPNAGTYSNDVPVTLTSDAPDATICYTLHRVLPACDKTSHCAQGSMAYDATSPVRITATGTQLRAIACAHGRPPSSEASAEYVLAAASPTFKSAPGSSDPSKPAQLFVATTTVDGVIHYTLDGSRPDCNSPAAPKTGELPPFAGGTTVNALTCKDHYVPSAIATTTSSSSVCTGDYVVFGREALEALSRCERITGRLTIASYDLTDLAPLARLARIDGALDIYNSPKLTSLHGLEALKTIGTTMYVTNNVSLADLDALASLQAVEGVIYIQGNAITEWIGPKTLTRVGTLAITGESKLRHVGGFAALTELASNLEVINNPVLTAFDDMPALTTFPRAVTIRDNASLEGVSGFTQARALDSLELSGNAKLTHFPAFTHIETVRERLDLDSNPLLSELDFRDLRSVGGVLHIAHLPRLTSLHGLDALTTVGGLEIEGQLGFNDLKGLERLTTVAGVLRVDATTGLVALTGLDNVTVAGQLGFLRNQDLESLRGLEKLGTLTEPYDAISIIENAALNEVGGLNAITRSAGSIDILGNPKLTRLKGLRGVQTARAITVQNNAALSRLDGLDALALVTGDVVIGGNAFTSFDELPALSAVNRDFKVRDEPLLTHLNGPSALQSIGRYLYVEQNPALARIDAFGQLTALRYDLYIDNNAVLPPCQADRIVTSLRAHGYSGTVHLENNGGTGSCASSKAH